MDKERLPAGQREKCPGCLNQLTIDGYRDGVPFCYIAATRGKRAEALLKTADGGNPVGCLSFEPDFLVPLKNWAKQSIMSFIP